MLHQPPPIERKHDRVGPGGPRFQLGLFAIPPGHAAELTRITQWLAFPTLLFTTGRPVLRLSRDGTLRGYIGEPRKRNVTAPGSGGRGGQPFFPESAVRNRESGEAQGESERTPPRHKASWDPGFRIDMQKFPLDIRVSLALPWPQMGRCTDDAEGTGFIPCPARGGPPRAQTAAGMSREPGANQDGRCGFLSEWVIAASSIVSDIPRLVSRRIDGPPSPSPRGGARRPARGTFHCPSWPLVFWRSHVAP